MENKKYELLENQAIIIKAIYSRNSNYDYFVGFSKNYKDASYIFEKLEEKTRKAHNVYTYTSFYLPVEGEIKDKLYIVNFGYDGHCRPIKGFPTDKQADDYSKELFLKTGTIRMIIELEEITPGWVDKFNGLINWSETPNFKIIKS